jgi:hypothetical protein
VDSSHPNLLATYPNAHSRPNIKLTSLPHIERSLQTLRFPKESCPFIGTYPHAIVSTLWVGICQGKSLSFCQRNSRIPDPRFPETGNLSTRHLLKSDGPPLLWGFHHGKSRSLVTRTPDLAISDFPKWEISRHVASVNRMAQIYPGVSTMESPDLLSTGLPISRLPFSRNG